MGLGGGVVRPGFEPGFRPYYTKQCVKARKGRILDLAILPDL